MKPEEIEICKEAFNLDRKGWWIDAERYEKLEKVIHKRIIKQINAAKNPSRCILLVGEDDDLTDGVVSYILHSKKYLFREYLLYVNYTNQTEEEVKTDLLKPERFQPHYESGGIASYYTLGFTLFLRDLAGCGILRQLASFTRDYSRQDKHGALIVSKKSDAGLSEDFRRQFDIINLDSEKQDPSEKVIPFPTPSGATWNELEISFIDRVTVNLTIRDKTKKVTYAEMGFKDGRAGKPSNGWAFLKELAKNNGQLTDYPQETKEAVEKKMSTLRGKLTAYFEKISNNPIPYTKTKNYAGYKTAFTIEDKSYMREHEDSIRKQDESENKHFEEESEDKDSDSDFTNDD